MSGSHFTIIELYSSRLCEQGRGSSRGAPYTCPARGTWLPLAYTKILAVWASSLCCIHIGGSFSRAYSDFSMVPCIQWSQMHADLETIRHPEKCSPQGLQT